MSKRSNSVSIIGLGYIGLPTAVLLSKHGNYVIGVDTNEKVVETLNSGKIHIKEPGLKSLLIRAIEDGNFNAVTKTEESDIFIITVPTPIDQNNKPDISYVIDAAHSIAGVIKKGDLIILESTSPVGTTEKVSKIIQNLRKDLVLPTSDKNKNDINIAYCPERVIPGNTLYELVNNDRVIGGITEKCSEEAEKFYKLFLKGKSFRTDAKTAELSKLIENSYRDVNISFANEVSMIAEEMGIDVWELIKISNRHPRVNILSPGPGVGGHCIPVDPWFIVDSSEKARLIKTARLVNIEKTEFIVNKVLDHIKRISSIKGNSKNLVVTFLGLTFKPNIDDLRDSPALEIVRRIAEQSPISINIVEPNIDELPSSISDKSVLKGIDVAIDEADLIVNLVSHREFESIRKSQIEGKALIDTQGTIG